MQRVTEKYVNACRHRSSQVPRPSHAPAPHYCATPHLRSDHHQPEIATECAWGATPSQCQMFPITRHLKSSRNSDRAQGTNPSDFQMYKRGSVVVHLNTSTEGIIQAIHSRGWTVGTSCSAGSRLSGPSAPSTARAGSPSLVAVASASSTAAPSIEKKQSRGSAQAGSSGFSPNR